MKTATAMCKYLIAGALVAFGFLVVPAQVFADEVNCTTSYGGGVVCGETTEDEEIPEVEVIEAGFEDVNFMLVALLAGTAGAVFYSLSRLTRHVYILD